jgi:hypothetical protein
VHGPQILIRSLCHRVTPDKFENRWQYHSRSDRHSKISCWGILFDLLQHSPILRRHVAEQSVCFGVNHEMSDFRMNRKKNLDLVLCTPNGSPLATTFADLVAQHTIDLSPEERDLLADLPVARCAPVGSVRLALEAKACMTAHIRAIPRLHDELNSSHMAIHGAADEAIAVGFAVVNVSETFLSSDSNKVDLTKKAPTFSHNPQPNAASRVIQKLREIPRRTKLGEDGFDAMGITTVDFVNDGSPVRLWTQKPAPPVGDIFHYDAMIHRIAALYEARYKAG